MEGVKVGEVVGKEDWMDVKRDVVEGVEGDMVYVSPDDDDDDGVLVRSNGCFSVGGLVAAGLSQDEKKRIGNGESIWEWMKAHTYLITYGTQTCIRADLLMFGK